MEYLEGLDAALVCGNSVWPHIQSLVSLHIWWVRELAHCSHLASVEINPVGHILQVCYGAHTLESPVCIKY